MNKFTAESGHWYDMAGNPAYQTIGKNGLERNTTLADARKNQLVPSVTTIMGIASKPALENWKIDQALLAASTLTRGNDESLDDFMSRAKWESKKKGKQAAERGTEIHAEIERGFRGRSSVAYTAVRKVLDALYPNETWLAEESFTSRHGYGGKMDLRSKAGVFVDFKTKDNLDPQAKPPIYDEHGMQLSAYAEGASFLNPERVSIFLDRADPSIVSYHVWSGDTHKKHLDMFLNLLSFWKLSKNYDPTQEVK